MNKAVMSGLERDYMALNYEMLIQNWREVIEYAFEALNMEAKDHAKLD